MSSRAYSNTDWGVNSIKIHNFSKKVSKELSRSILKVLCRLMVLVIGEKTVFNAGKEMHYTCFEENSVDLTALSIVPSQNNQ